MSCLSVISDRARHLRHPRHRRGTTTAAAAEATTAATAETAAAAAAETTAAPTAEARVPAAGLPVGYSAGPDVPKGVAAAAWTGRPLTCTGVRRQAVVLRSVVALRLLAAALRSAVDLQVAARHQAVATSGPLAGTRSVTASWPLSGTRPSPPPGRCPAPGRSPPSGPKHLISTASAEIHPILTSATKGIVTEPRANVRIVVPHPYAMAGLCCQLFPPNGLTLGRLMLMLLLPQLHPPPQ